MSRAPASPHPSIRSQMWGLCALASFACGVGGPPTICASTEDAALSQLCVLDANLMADGGFDARLTRCQAMTDSQWRDACIVQLAEQEAWTGNLNGAFEACLQSTTLTRACTARVVWQGMEHRRVATPTDADAQARVDAFIAALPTGDVAAALRGFQGADHRARASAWHSVYAGTGSTDPTALTSAIKADAPMARSAFAWEAVRLLPDTLGIEATITRVQDLAAGRVEPVVGAPEDLTCTDYDVMPRLDEDFRLQPYIRAFGSWQRFVDADPDTDLRVATLDALLVQRGRFEGLAGLDHRSEAVRKTISRHIALLAPSTCSAKNKGADIDPECADLIEAVGPHNSDGVRFAAGAVRKALQEHHSPAQRDPEVCP